MLSSGARATGTKGPQEFQDFQVRRARRDFGAQRPAGSDRSAGSTRLSGPAGGSGTKRVSGSNRPWQGQGDNRSTGPGVTGLQGLPGVTGATGAAGIMGPMGPTGAEVQPEQPVLQEQQARMVFLPELLSRNRNWKSWYAGRR